MTIHPHCADLAAKLVEISKLNLGPDEERERIAALADDEQTRIALENIDFTGMSPEEIRETVIDAKFDAVQLDLAIAWMMADAPKPEATT